MYIYVSDLELYTSVPAFLLVISYKFPIVTFLTMQGRKKVAIVGSGCSGIGAFWALKSTSHEVHLYEAADYLGGHTNTVVFKNGDKEINVDTGFIVMNTATYR